jgi:hypothetical protein
MQVEGRHTLRRNHTTSVGVEHDRAEDVVVLALAVGGGEVEATARRGRVWPGGYRERSRRAASALVGLSPQPDDDSFGQPARLNSI